MEKIIEINKILNDYVCLILLIGTGVLMTCCTKFFQITHIKHWFKETIGSLFRKDSDSVKKTDKKTISQFQALCTALAATVGTGNIAGVAAAIVVGGPGAVFWMWVAAFFGMMTSFSEKVLGIYYRRRNANGEWSGGAMYYLKDGLGRKKGFKTIASVLAVLFSCFTILASFGIGNMGQVNKITLNIQSAFFSNVEPVTVGGVSVVALIIGVILVILGALIILGGLQRIAAVTEKVVPFMAGAYIIGALAILFMNIENLGSMFGVVFKFAFTERAAYGGVLGTVILAMTQGFKRGVFSNEAGLGSSVIVHCSANVKEPVRQGMWGVFEVFFDTIVICTMTAILVLSSGYIDLTTGNPTIANLEDSTLVSRIFGDTFGYAGEVFIAISLFLFAFTTILGWSQYGGKAVEYLFGIKAVKVYKIIFVMMIVSGAIITSDLAWEISDIFNGFMMIPNLIAVITLCPLVIKITKNYINRKIKHKDEKPLLSYDESIQKELEEEFVK